MEDVCMRKVEIVMEGENGEKEEMKVVLIGGSGKWAQGKWNVLVFVCKRCV